jgi:hypothetical protein
LRRERGRDATASLDIEEVAAAEDNKNEETG